MIASKYSHLIGILLVSVLALVLRLHHLDHESLFMDELRQISFYDYSFWNIAKLAATQTQPPLDYWVGSLFYNYYSISDFSVRLPAVIFGTASVLLMTWLCSKLFSLPIGLIIGTFMAINHYLIYFSQDARPYSIAIFFFIAVLATLMQLLNTRAPTKWHYLLLFVTACLFLITRTLVPMLCLMLLLTFTLGVTIQKRDSREVFIKYRKISITLAASLIIYAPFFATIYQTNQRYLATGVDSFAAFYSALSAFTLENIWRIISVQAGNIAPLLIALSILPFVFWWHDRSTENKRYMLLSGFLIMVFLSHIFIHHFKSAFPFRPPYAIYLLPMMLLISAYSLSQLMPLMEKHMSRKYIIALVTVIFLVPQSISTYAYKGMKIKSDWRSLASFVEREYDNDYLLIFETLDKQDRWDSGLYGLQRYQHGTALGVKLEELITDIRDIQSSRQKPVLILFHYRNYYLTPAARHGIMSLDHDDPPMLQLTQTMKNIQLIHFTGFSVLSLKQYSDDLPRDIDELLAATLSVIPADSSSVRMRLLKILLSDADRVDQEIKIQEIADLSRPSQADLVRLAQQKLKALNPE